MENETFEIDITPSWSGLIPVIIELVKQGGSSGKNAETELRDMASKLDLAINQLKELRS